jgi:hypothetical protein
MLLPPRAATHAYKIKIIIKTNQTKPKSKYIAANMQLLHNETNG